MADDRLEPGQEGDTGATGRAPRPPRQPDHEWDELDSSFADEPRGFEAIFGEEDPDLDPEPARRAPVEDFGFDEIARDEEPRGRSRTARARGAAGRVRGVAGRAGVAARGRARAGARPARAGGGRSRGGGARGGGGRGGGGGRRGAAAGSPLASPAGRLALGALFVVVLIVVLAFVIRDCRRDQVVDSYKTYVNSAGQVAEESAQQGQRLLLVMQNREGRNASALQAQVRELSTQAQGLVQRAEDLDPPGGLADADRDLVTALRYRANGLRLLSEGLPNIIRSDNNRFASRSIADTMKRFSASDVIYKDSFVDVVQAKVRDEDIAGLEVAGDALFLPGNNDRFASEAGARTLLTPLRRQGGASSGNNSGGNLRGTSLVSVRAVPSDTTLQAGTVTTIPASASLAWEVTVRNGGDFVENGVVVTATLTYPSAAGDAEAQEATIETIEAGQEKTVRIAGPPSNAQQPGEEASLAIAVRPVEGEQNTDNNSAEYPVTITFG